MYVWIDPDLCMGAGTCEDIAPEVFVDRGDGIWGVKEDARFFGSEMLFDGRNAPGHGPDGRSGRARIPDSLLDVVIEAAEDCPGECIYLEA